MYSPHRGCVRTLRTLYVYATLFIYSDAWIHDDNCNRFYCAVLCIARTMLPQDA